MPAPQLNKLSPDQLRTLQSKLSTQIQNKGDRATDQEKQLLTTITGMVSKLPKQAPAANDAKDTQQAAANSSPDESQGQTQVWYAKPPMRRLFGQGVFAMREHGVPPPDPNDLAETHIHLINVKPTDPVKVMQMMQGEKWSPDGSAVKLVKSKGLNHVSMSVGDVIVAPGRTVMVDTRGFYDLGSDRSMNEDLDFSSYIDKGLVLEREDYSVLAFRPGEVVFAGSKKGTFVRFATPSCENAIIELSNGELDVVPVASMSSRDPGMMKRAGSWMMGEDHQKD